MVLRVRDLADQVLVDQLVLAMQRTKADDVERLVAGLVEERLRPSNQPMAIVGVPVDRFVESLAKDVARWIDIKRRPVGSVCVPMERGRLVDLSEERVLGQESTELGIEVAGFCVVEAGLGVEDVPS